MSGHKLLSLVFIVISAPFLFGCSSNVSVGNDSLNKTSLQEGLNSNTHLQSPKIDPILENIINSDDTSQKSIESDLEKLDSELDLNMSFDDLENL